MKSFFKYLKTIKLETPDIIKGGEVVDPNDPEYLSFLKSLKESQTSSKQKSLKRVLTIKR